MWVVNFNWKTESLSLVMIATMAVLAVIAWPTAPDRIPMHWDFSGTPDRFGGKFEGLAVPPLLAAGLYLYVLVRQTGTRGSGSGPFNWPQVLIRTGVVGLIFGVYVFVLTVIF